VEALKQSVLQAQQCAILKSDIDGKPKSLLAKLEAGLQTQYADALRCLNSLVCVLRMRVLAALFCVAATDRAHLSLIFSLQKTCML
jgi:hypothetical protein